ncbi:phage holin family protein [Listeria monocytogenes]|uniref:phage holin family protein n=1 Tax=Listeria monocytogenes TaxID=1639 RepID=UPI000873615A|nr:phage holin family protein [Listeria monocytogenes]EAE0845488.1 holin [Listeria monocytogenes]EHD1577651.1 phage holin family protein [Listeria monocytogenes]EKZ4845807.1 phage holin family protein [Listeria monocytogenes]ELO8894173.1 phage holin family protein [Listeria monocytogenes]OFG61587.1 holin [Listeria monocytogenes]
MLIDNLALLHQFQLLLNDLFVQVFMFSVLFDIATGMAKGIAGKQGNSTKGLLGIVKHMLITILVLIAYPYMKLLHLDTLAISFISFYILAYGISIMENWGQLGLPLPSFIKDHLEKLKNLSDKGNLSIHIDVDKKEEK